MMRLILMASALLAGTAADAQKYYARAYMPGIAKASATSDQPSWTHCARESSPCTLPASGAMWTVRYGVEGKWTYKTFASPNGLDVPCDNYTFPDPAHEINKDCFRTSGTV
jgi:hypothetical protein